MDPCEEGGYNIGRDDSEMDNSAADLYCKRDKAAGVVVDISGRTSLDCPIKPECLCLADHQRVSES